MLHHPLSDDALRLLLRPAHRLKGRCFFEHPVRHLQRLVGVKISRDGQHHVVQVVEGVVAAVEQVGVDPGNRLDGARDVHLDAIVVVKAVQQVKGHPPARVVLIHADLLPDDALLLLHRLLGEVGVGHAVQQNLQRLLEFARAGEQVAGLVEAGEGVGGGSGLGVPVKCVAVLALKHLVLQVVGDALRHPNLLSPLLRLEAGVDRAVLGREHGVGGGKSRHGVEQHGQSRRMLHPDILFAQVLVLNDLAAHLIPPPFPVRLA